MANCVRCGREGPALSEGEISHLCPECRQAEAPTLPPVRSEVIPPTAGERRRAVSYRPPVTVALVGLNLLVFAGMVLTGGHLMQPTTAQLLKWGADFGPLTLDSEPWRVLTSNYVHIGLFHILFNMWCLWDLGRVSERIFGRWTYLLIYSACGVAGSLASLWLHPMVVGAGASGAIFGLAGALITALYLGRLPYPGETLRRMMRSLLTFAGYNLLFGAAIPGIDNSAHIGGLVMGLALGALLASRLTESPDRRLAYERVLFTATAFLLIGFSTFVRQQNGYVAAFHRASQALDLGQTDRAIAELEHAVVKKPNDRIALGLLGRAYLQKKDYAGAEAAWKHLLELDPRNAQAKYYLGIIYGSTQRYEESRQIFADLTRRDPQNDDAWVFLGMAQDGLGREPDAIHAYQKAIAVNPNNARAYRQLGRAQLKSNHTDAGIASLEHSAQLDPTNAQTYMDLAQAYTATGRRSQADAAWRRAQALKKGGPE
jgi:rhomboid protease GluP